MPPSFRQAAASCLLPLLIVCLPACASAGPRPGPLPPPLEAGTRTALGTIAVVPSAEVPVLEKGDYARGRGGGALRGAGKATLGWLDASTSGSCGDGWGCAIWLIVVIVFLPLVAIGGAIYGAATTPPQVAVHEMEAVLHDMLAPGALSRPVAQAVLDFAREQGLADVVAPEDGATPDTRLEVGIRRIGSIGSGVDPPLAFWLEGHARLVRSSDGAELRGLTVPWVGRTLRISEWALDGGKALREELELPRHRIAETILEEMLLVMPIASAPPFGLRPIDDPEAQGERTWAASRRRPVRLSTFTPTLRWEPFPPADRPGAGASWASRATEISYELRFARAGPGDSFEEVQRRDGLASPELTIDEAVVWPGLYLWTVRARFRLDGQPRVTEWAAIDRAGMAAGQALGPGSYRFRIPRKVPDTP